MQFLETSPVHILLLFSLLMVEDLSVTAVNSPQMTFYTPPSHETMIHLESKYGYSATLKLKRPKLVEPSLNRNLTEKANEKKLTEFIVMGPDYPFYGVTAVIQEMNLRTDLENNRCKDFIQFGKNSSIVGRTQEICGTISKSDDWSDPPSGSRLQRSYFNPDGNIHLFFYSDQADEEASLGKVLEYEDDIGIEIVFTSFTVCPNPANSWKKLQACSSTDQTSCIYSTLFCDSKIDCGFPGEFGLDEEGCYIPYIYMTVSIVAAILLTVTLIYTFVRWVTKVPKEYR